MKLISYSHNGKESFGIVSGAGIVDAGAALGGKYADLRTALAAGALSEIEALAGASADVSLDDITYLKPITNPVQFFCIGRNFDEYHEVVEDKKRPEYPSVFPKLGNAMVAHQEPLVRPNVSDQLDYECELAVVIGKQGRHIPEADVFDYVLGYTVCNEGAVRDWQKKGSQNCPGKNFFRSGSIGPWIVTKDEVADPDVLSIKTWVDGELRQDGTTGSMICKIPYLISHISNFTQLEPGDIISTGSPGGTAISMDGTPWLTPGQTIAMEVGDLGRLENPIIAE